ncbi:TonB-dependent receptor domain-containing protein [Neisseriaceae bacterium B1]
MDYRNTFATNLYQPIYRDTPTYSSNALFGNQLSDSQTTNRTRLHGLVLGDTISALDDKLLLTLGARWQRIQTEGYAYNTGLQNSQYKKNRLSPSLGVVYRITPQWSVYGNYIESLAQGAIASDKTARNFGEALKPYVSKQKELGVKYQGERFGAGLSLFHTSRPRIATRNGIAGENGKDRFQGAELNVYGEAYPGVRLLGGVVLLDTKQKTYRQRANRRQARYWYQSTSSHAWCRMGYTESQRFNLRYGALLTQALPTPTTPTRSKSKAGHAGTLAHVTVRKSQVMTQHSALA